MGPHLFLRILKIQKQRWPMKYFFFFSFTHIRERCKLVQAETDKTYQILCQFQDTMRDILSNIALRLREFPREKPEGIPKGGGLYLTVYPESNPNTGSISFLRIILVMIASLISLTICPYTPQVVYCEIYPLLESNTVKIPYLKMIY